MHQKPKCPYLINLDRREPKSQSPGQNVAAFSILNRLLEEGAPIEWALQDFRAFDQTHPAGTFFIQESFQNRLGIPGNLIMSWQEMNIAHNGICCMEKTLGPINVDSKKLVVPRIALFYDATTYDNALVHCLAFRSMGFKVILACARDLLKDESDPDSVLARSNVFVMPGGSMHFSSFSSSMDAAKATSNLRSFVCNGGGYIGVCAGATEALMGNPNPHLNLVDASYHADWFIPRQPADGDWEWRTLMGPLLLDIMEPQHPVTFGYGPNAVLPEYGPRVAVEYFGGPSMINLGRSVTVLARYGAPVNQTPCERVQDIWGSAAIVSSYFGSGKVVLFGPHPEWPGPCRRMYAQALYYVASKPKPLYREKSFGQHPVGSKDPSSISSESVQAIVQTAEQAGMVLGNCMNMCNSLVGLGTGDRGNPLGIWYDKTILTFTKELMAQMDEIARHAREFWQEYCRLSGMAYSFAGDPRALQWIDCSRRMIEGFFSYAENLPPSSHPIVDLSGLENPSRQQLSLPCDPRKFSDLLSTTIFIDKYLTELVIPCIGKYAKIFHHHEKFRSRYVSCHSDENKRAMDELYLKITSLSSPGPLYRAMSSLRSTLDVMQYLILVHLLNLLKLADYAGDMLSLTYYALSMKGGLFLSNSFGERGGCKSDK
jgi:hypothetical protein